MCAVDVRYRHDEGISDITRILKQWVPDLRLLFCQHDSGALSTQTDFLTQAEHKRVNVTARGSWQLTSPFASIHVIGVLEPIEYGNTFWRTEVVVLRSIHRDSRSREQSLQGTVATRATVMSPTPPMNFSKVCA